MDEQPDSGIAEVAATTHLPDADVAVPVRYGPVAGGRLEPHAAQSVDWRDHNRERGTVQRDDVGSVKSVMAWIVLSGSPRPEFGFRGVVQRWRERHDRTDIQVGVRPSIETSSDSRRERVVDGRVAQRARHPHFCQLARLVHGSLDADHRVQPQQFERDGGIGEIDLATSKRVDDRPWKRLDVDLQTNGQRRCRVHCRNDLVHPQHIRPQLLVSEGVKTEDVLSFATMRIAL